MALGRQYANTLVVVAPAHRLRPPNPAPPEGVRGPVTLGGYASERQEAVATERIRQDGFVGRQSRKKKERANDPAMAARARAIKNERYGRGIPPTAEGYEWAARRDGGDGVIRALISRHNQRWENVRRLHGTLGESVAETMHVVYPIDVILWQHGVRFVQPPSSSYGSWPEHLRWGVDSACQAQRMILAGNLVGAASIARTQLERWSDNRTRSNDFVHPQGVPVGSHYEAIWANEHPAVDAGQVWVELSELLHGRGPLVAAVHWEAGQLCAPKSIGAVNRAVVAVETAIQLSLRQILLCVATLTLEAGYPPSLGDALRQLPLSLPSEVQFVESAALTVWPMNYEFVKAISPSLRRVGDAYIDDVRQRASRREPRDLVYSARGLEAFVSRRARSAGTAADAFAKEAEQLGDKFDPTGVAAREHAYILINEVAALLATWRADLRSDALLVGASALRAAYWLWLEDDERSMMLARTVLEQTARLRTWRLRSHSAAILEERGANTTTRDWLREAGWRRLSILNRSLGEFSHATMRARWSGARDALVAIQAPGPNDEFEAQTGRGAALNAVAFAFGTEVAALAAEQHLTLAQAFASVLPYGDDDDPQRQIEAWLDRCWSHRSLSFGPPDLRPPGEDGS